MSMIPQRGDRQEVGRGIVEKARVGLRPRRGSAFPPLVCSHLGRLPREVPLTAARPIQVGLPTCPCSSVSLPGTEKPSATQGAQ